MAVVYLELVDQQDTVIWVLEFYFVKRPSADASCEAEFEKCKLNGC